MTQTQIVPRVVPFKVIICMPKQWALCTLLALSFFPFKEIFLILIIKGEKLHTKVMQNIYIYIRYHTLHYANTGFGQVTRKVLLSNTGLSSLYTNIDTDEGLAIVEEQLGKTNQNKPSPKTFIVSPREGSQTQQFYLWQ